jgi:hypothetical protein
MTWSCVPVPAWLSTCPWPRCSRPLLGAELVTSRAGSGRRVPRRARRGAGAAGACPAGAHRLGGPRCAGQPRRRCGRPGCADPGRARGGPGCPGGQPHLPAAASRLRGLCGRPEPCRKTRCGWQRRAPMPASARSLMPGLNAAGRPVRNVLAGHRSLQRAGLSHGAHPYLTGGHPRPPSGPCPWSGAPPGRPELAGCDASGAGSQLEV